MSGLMDRLGFLSEVQRNTWIELLEKEKDLNAHRTKGKKPEKEEIERIRNLRNLKKDFIDSLPSEHATSLRNLNDKTSSQKPTKKQQPDSEASVLAKFQHLAITSGKTKHELVDIGMNLHDSMSYLEILPHLDRAKAAGVTRIILTGSTSSNCATASTFCHTFYSSPPVGMKIYHTAGIHPHCAKQAMADSGELDKAVFDKLETLIQSPFCVSLGTLRRTYSPVFSDSGLLGPLVSTPCAHFSLIFAGECGLDYDRMLSSRSQQMMVFQRHLQIFAKNRGKIPLFVHLREPDNTDEAGVSAIDDLERLLKEIGTAETSMLFSRIVVHCFTSNGENMRRLYDLGVMIGFTGYIGLSKRSSETLQGIRDMYQAEGDLFLQRLMIETDAPYMKPDKSAFEGFFRDSDVSFGGEIFKIVKRNKRGANEPATLPVTAHVLARVLKMSVVDVAKLTTSNAVKFFRLEEADSKIRSALEKK